MPPPGVVGDFLAQDAGPEAREAGRRVGIEAERDEMASHSGNARRSGAAAQRNKTAVPPAPTAGR